MSLCSLVTQMVKGLPAMWDTRFPSLHWEDPLEKEMATHFSILAWKIPWTEELGRLQSMGSQESDTTEQLHSCLHATLQHIKLSLFFHVNLSYANIIIRAAKESRRKEGENFLPLQKHRLDFLDNIYIYKHSKFKEMFHSTIYTFTNI